MLFQYRNPAVYVRAGYRYHRKYSWLLRYDLLCVQLPEMHKSMLLLHYRLQVLQHRLQVLRFSVRIHLLSGLSVFRKCYLHHEDRNGLLHAGCYGIHKKKSDKSEQLLHPLPDPGFPVLHEAVTFQILVFFLHMFFYSFSLTLCLWQSFLFLFSSCRLPHPVGFVCFLLIAS